MKKVILKFRMFITLIILSITLILMLCSCDKSGEYVDIEVEVIDKYTAIESEYDWFWEGFRTYTAYYLVLENGDVEDVTKEDYAKYQIGDNYSTRVWVEYGDVQENDSTN